MGDAKHGAIAIHHEKESTGYRDVREIVLSTSYTRVLLSEGLVNVPGQFHRARAARRLDDTNYYTENISSVKAF